MAYMSRPLELLEGSGCPLFISESFNMLYYFHIIGRQFMLTWPGELHKVWVLYLKKNAISYNLIWVNIFISMAMKNIQLCVCFYYLMSVIEFKLKEV